MKNFYQSKHFKTVILAIFILISISAWIILKISAHYYLKTDNAYVNANVIKIAPRVTGKVMQVLVENNQFIEKNQPLFNIDIAPFLADLASAKAQVTISEAKLTKANLTANRVLSLVKRNFLSPQNGDDALALQKTALGELAAAKAALDQAALHLEYTQIKSPQKGWITNLTLRPGNILTANQPIFSIISNDVFWVDANFKETEIEKIHPGQLGTITADMYPKHPFKGIVESISGGAGAAFSLLPPQNASGNWVKITQRVPVRIRVVNPDPKYPLRIGTSTTVTIQLQEYLQQK